MGIVIMVVILTLNLAGLNNNMKPWEMVWNVMSGKGETPPLAQTPSNPADNDYYARLAKAESGGNVEAKATTSSAVGPFQFVEKTWLEQTKAMGKDYALDARTDYAKAKEVVQHFTEKNREYLQNKLGREVGDTDLYAAHFLGNQGASKLLTAKPFMTVDKVVDKRALTANKNVFYDKVTKKPRTVAEVYKILQTKIGE